MVFSEHQPKHGIQNHASIVMVFSEHLPRHGVRNPDLPLGTYDGFINLVTTKEFIYIEQDEDR